MSRMTSPAATSSTLFTFASATTTSAGRGTFPVVMILFASPASSGSASDLPIGFPAASRKVFAMPPPTIRRSTFFASSPSTESLVDTYDPPTIAASGRASRATTRGDFPGQSCVVFLLALVDPAVLQHDHLSWLDLHAVYPVSDQRNFFLEQF